MSTTHRLNYRIVVLTLWLRLALRFMVYIWSISGTLCFWLYYTYVIQTYKLGLCSIHFGIFLLTLQGPALLYVLLGTLDSDHNSYKKYFFFILSIKNECVFILALKFQFFFLSPHFFSFYSSVKLILIPFVTWRKMMDYPISIGIIWNGQITVSRLVQSSSSIKGPIFYFI